MNNQPQHPNSTTVPTVGHFREESRGRAVGIAVLAYFALAWTGWGMSAGVPTAVEAPLTATSALCFLALVGGAVVVYRRAASLPSGHDVASGRRISRRFGIIVAAEFIGLVILASVLAATGHSQLIPAVVCLGVGIHFFPLRRLFNLPIYDRTGAALCAIAIATALLATLTHQPALWTMLPGFGAALTLYTTSALLLHAERPWRHVTPSPPADASG